MRYLVLSFLQTEESGFYVKILNVGQGDAILIRTPKGRNILVDGGPNYDVESFLPSSFDPLNCKVDLLVLTHAHDDHSKGLARILSNCRVGMVSQGLSSILGKGITMKEFYKGDSFAVDGIYFKILWPPRNYESNDENDKSVVLLLSYKNRTMLLSGDVSGDILCSFASDTDLGDIYFYKVSHHASISGYCEYLSPEISVISVGKNKFGHPDKRIINFLENKDSKVFRTDIQGTVTIN